MKKLLLLFFSIICGLTAFAQSADAILNKAEAKLNAAKSVTATYTITADGELMSGEITLAGDKFVIDCGGIKSWYDGKTQWTYSAEIGEVNVTEPTDEELAQVNPFAIIRAFRSGFTSKVTADNASSSTIEMLPKNKKSDIKKVILTLAKSTLYPSSIVIYMSGGSKLDIKIKSFAEGMMLPDSKFRFTSSMLPGVEVIDLR